MATDTPSRPWRRLQRRRVAQQKAHGESLRAWLQDRAAAAEKRRADARKAEALATELAGKARIRARKAARRDARQGT